jgi:hypothetical protein
MENVAYVFQHQFTGVQIFVYHANDIEDAKFQFNSLVLNSSDWIYLKQAVANDR